MKALTKTFAVAFLLVLLVNIGDVIAQSLYTAKKPLQVTNIKPAGVEGISAGNRIFRAHPGIEYNIRAAVVGGLYPYKFWLSGAPTGMVVDSITGEIVWPQPNTTTGTINLHVRDSEGTETMAQWSITVSPQHFLFVDVVNGNDQSNTGAIDSPFKTMAPAYSGKGTGQSIIYFRAGNHMVVNGEDMRITSSVPCIWIGYPGEHAAIDFNDTHIQLNGNQCYFDDLEMTNMMQHAFFAGWEDNYRTFRRIEFHDLDRNSSDNNNQGFWFTASDHGADRGNNAVAQDCKFHDYNAVTGFGSLYQQNKMLIEDCEFFNGTGSGIGVKSQNDSLTIRHNVFHDLTVSDALLGQVANGAFKSATEIEICFNLFYNVPDGKNAMHIAWPENSTGFHIYRNTIIGRPALSLSAPGFGELSFYNNVVVQDANNDRNGLYCMPQRCPNKASTSVTQYADEYGVKVENNLVAKQTSDILNADYSLNPANQQYLGTRGWETLNPGQSASTPKAQQRAVASLPVQVRLLGNGKLNCDLGFNVQSEAVVTVHNSLGRQIHQQVRTPLQQRAFEIDLSSASNGMLLVSVQSNGQVSAIKVMNVNQ